jgi:hypothetical protein
MDSLAEDRNERAPRSLGSNRVRSWLVKKNLILDNSGFYIKDRHYLFDDVDSIYFHHTLVQKTVNFVASGIDHDVTVKIYLRSQPTPLTINSGAIRGYGFYLSYGFGSFGKNSSESLRAKCEEICRRTFEQRCRKYAASLKKNGYFIYDGKKFCENGDLGADNWKINLFRDKPFLKKPFVIWHEKSRQFSLLFGPQRFEIETTMDADVFFYLMDKIYHLRWS